MTGSCRPAFRRRAGRALQTRVCRAHAGEEGNLNAKVDREERGAEERDPHAGGGDSRGPGGVRRKGFRLRHSASSCCRTCAARPPPGRRVPGGAPLRKSRRPVGADQRKRVVCDSISERSAWSKETRRPAAHSNAAVGGLCRAAPARTGRPSFGVPLSLFPRPRGAAPARVPDRDSQRRSGR